MKLRLLSILGIIVLLALTLLLAGCDDNPVEAGQQLPDFSQFNILLYEDAVDVEALFAQQALDNLNANYTLASTPDEFFSAGSGQSWDLIVVENANYNSLDMLEALRLYYLDGGRVAISTFQVSNDATHALWSALGASFDGTISSDVDPVYKWVPGSSLFTFPNNVPNFTAMTDYTYTINNASGTALASATAMGGITTTPTAGNAVIFLNNSNRAILNSFLLADAATEVGDTLVPNDVDSDGVADAVEYWENQVVFLLNQSGVAPVPFPMQPAVTRSQGGSNAR